MTTNLGKEELAEVLAKHGYKVPQVMSPEWCQFALQLIQTELLEEIRNQSMSGGNIWPDFFLLIKSYQNK